ncbi:MAG: ribonuclease P protein component [Prevotella sp.]|nr:ribonuclease P protein component [Prevotella sp.]
MPVCGMLKLGKEERITSKKQIELLFSGSGSRSMTVFPLRIVYRFEERQQQRPQAQILVSVPKRFFKRAVKRNRVKRQIREAYRRNKGIVLRAMEKEPGKVVEMAFIWIDQNLHQSREIEGKMKKMLHRISENRWR